MLALPYAGFGEVQDNRAATIANTGPGVVLTGGAANTKGVYLDLIVADFDSYFIAINTGTNATSATNTSVVLDIALGGAGSEQIVLPDLLCGWAWEPGRQFYLPLFIPRGTTVRGRIAGLIASETISVGVWLWGGCRAAPWPTFREADAYGIGAASNGTMITPSATANTFGSWTSIGSATSREYKGFFVAHGGNTDVTMLSEGRHFNAGWGSTKMAGYYSRPNSSEGTYLFPNFPVFQPIPASTQLQGQSASSGSSGEAQDYAIYGLY